MQYLLFILLFLFGCSPTEPENVHGCLDSQACNYNPNATIDNNSCLYNDCAGECGGNALIDECGICNGLGSNEYFNCDNECIIDLDLDGVCDNIDDCIGEYDD